jgi:hypothetical protein
MPTMGTSASDTDAEGERSPMSVGGRQRGSDTGRGRQPERLPDTPVAGGPNAHLILNRPYVMNDRTPTLPAERQLTGSISPVRIVEDTKPEPASSSPPPPVRCINPASEVNARLDTQVEVRVYPCNNSQSSSGKKKCTTFTVKPEVSTGGLSGFACRHCYCNENASLYFMFLF